MKSRGSSSTLLWEPFKRRRVLSGPGGHEKSKQDERSEQIIRGEVRRNRSFAREPGIEERYRNLLSVETSFEIPRREIDAAQTKIDASRFATPEKQLARQNRANVRFDPAREACE